MFHRHNKTVWYQFCNFKHFLKAENSEDDLASSCEEFWISFHVTQYETFYWAAHSKFDSIIKNVLKNYRPVSNITFLGKLIEKIACARLTEHMDHHNFADSHQSAYRAAHSTESALIKVKNDIMLSIDGKKAVLLVLLDLSAAFDAIDHKILVSRLSKRIGVSGTALDWFQSYLEDWTSRVEIAGNLSKPITANFGLPQGSVVGPIGYSIYTVPVGDIARHHGVNYHVYADDTQLHVSFDPSDLLELENALRHTVLQNCTKDIKIWMNVNKLKLNESKTEFFVAASLYYEKHLPEITLTIGNSHIKPSQTVRNLGAYIDSNMTMASHITNVSRTITFHLRNISRIRRYIDKDTCHHAVRSLILSHIDYCNGLLPSLTKSYTFCLQCLQNWAARLVFTVNRQQDPKPLLKSLHWLPVKQRISFKLLLYVFKSLNGMAPVYLSNCFKLHIPKRNLSSSKDRLRLDYPRTRVQAGDKSFTVCASKLWNNIPVHIMQSVSVNAFKKALKTYLFPNWFIFSLCYIFAHFPHNFVLHCKRLEPLGNSAS